MSALFDFSALVGRPRHDTPHRTSDANARGGLASLFSGRNADHHGDVHSHWRLGSNGKLESRWEQD